FRYGYPLFDLNWSWLSVRLEMEQQYSQHTDSPLNYCLFLKSALIYSILIALFALSNQTKRLEQMLPSIGEMERKLIPLIVGLTGLWLGLKLTPMELVPHFGWCMFTINFVSLRC